ncbi:MAG: 1,4-alpha-glucan branching enzyme [Acidimicrobiales bacterium]|jgi:1,4-alpha-glucan branching enzyme|nr:1,4-alpha-glucan branching enzyme [Acidimicrobiales bacterium]
MAEAAREVSTPAPEVQALVDGRLGDPHRVLGPHVDDGDVVVRVWRPDAAAMRLVPQGAEPVEMMHLHPAGVFEGRIKAREIPDYRVEVEYRDGSTFTIDDPYRFWPTLGDLDLHLFNEGRHESLWRVLGAHHRVHQGAWGTAFAVWAPAAVSVRVVGDFNSWDGRIHPMRSIGSSGVWELFLPEVEPGAHYKYEIITANGARLLKADPFAFAAEVPPATASIVDHAPDYDWGDGEWLSRRAAVDPLRAPMSVYECHLGSWRRVPEDGDRALTYRELAQQLPAYLTEMGFTHVEFLPVAHHPFEGSWGYQVTSYYAPSSRFGSPDDFRALVDALHQAGIGVLVDWVPAHFPKDDFALARFDGTALYEHSDPRQGEHPDWGTLVFNFGRHEVRNFLIANALYWLEEFHVDGLRVDAVASMLYLDYSRKEGEWVPNVFGGRENLDAVAFVKEMNEVVYRRHPGVMTVAEESTAWPAVSRPTYLGGLGFGFKWNMGWMHDTLDYFEHDSIHRRYHHHELTFGLLYAFSENFVLPLSHDEVVHGKGSLLTKMPGDRWQQLANLRSLYGWMWAHPGRPLLFMGGEVAQEREWSHDRSVDWHLLADPGHAGMRRLVTELNRVSAAEPALWERDFTPDGFRWIDANDSDQSVLSFARFSDGGARVLVCVANLTPVPRPAYRVGLPRGGRWVELLNTDAEVFGGSNVGSGGERWAEPVPWHGLEHSAPLDLPPLGVVWFGQLP